MSDNQLNHHIRQLVQEQRTANMLTYVKLVLEHPEFMHNPLYKGYLQNIAARLDDATLPRESGDV